MSNFHALKYSKATLQGKGPFTKEQNTCSQIQTCSSPSTTLDALFFMKRPCYELCDHAMPCNLELTRSLSHASKRRCHPNRCVQGRACGRAVPGGAGPGPLLEPGRRLAVPRHRLQAGTMPAASAARATTGEGLPETEAGPEQGRVERRRRAGSWQHHVSVGRDLPAPEAGHLQDSVV